DVPREHLFTIERLEMFIEPVAVVVRDPVQNLYLDARDQGVQHATQAFDESSGLLGAGEIVEHAVDAEDGREGVIRQDVQVVANSSDRNLMRQGMGTVERIRRKLAREEKL